MGSEMCIRDRSKPPVRNNPGQAQSDSSPRKTLQRQNIKIAQRIAEIERRLAALESQLSGIVELLSDPALYSDAAQSTGTGQEYHRLSGEIDLLTAEWEELSTEAEKVKAALTGCS